MEYKNFVRVVEWGKGVMNLASPGHPTDLGFQLGNACYPCSWWVREGMFLFLLFLHFYSFSSFSVSLFFISSAISSVSLLPFSWRWHKMTLRGWCVIKPQHNQFMFSWRWFAWNESFYFIVSGEISVYLMKIKVVSITSELISYHFTSDWYDLYFHSSLWTSSVFFTVSEVDVTSTSDFWTPLTSLFLN